MKNCNDRVSVAELGCGDSFSSVMGEAEVAFSDARKTMQTLVLPRQSFEKNKPQQSSLSPFTSC